MNSNPRLSDSNKNKWVTYNPDKFVPCSRYVVLGTAFQKSKPSSLLVLLFFLRGIQGWKLMSACGQMADDFQSGLRMIYMINRALSAQLVDDSLHQSLAWPAL